MTIVVPVPIPPAGLPLPDPADRATFSARKLEQLRWANNEYSTGSKALADASYENALDAQANAVAVAADALVVAANTALAASYAGATVWVSGTTYVIGDTRWSPLDSRVYRRKTAGAGTTDPSADATNWAYVSTDRPMIVVSGTTVTCAAGFDYVLTNVAASTATLPASPTSGDTGIRLWMANGLTTNVIARNGQTIMGSATDMTYDIQYSNPTFRFVNGTWRFTQ